MLDDVINLFEIKLNLITISSPILCLHKIQNITTFKLDYVYLSFQNKENDNRVC